MDFLQESPHPAEEEYLETEEKPVDGD